MPCGEDKEAVGAQLVAEPTSKKKYIILFVISLLVVVFIGSGIFSLLKVQKNPKKIDDAGYKTAEDAVRGYFRALNKGRP